MNSFALNSFLGRSMVAVVILMLTCCSAKVAEPITISGNTMGTTYHITYFDANRKNFKDAIDSLLVDINSSISTYIPESEISRFNKDQHGISFISSHFSKPLTKAFEVYSVSQGAFDPTVMPLVNAWGFGPNHSIHADSTIVDSLLQFVGLHHIKTKGDSIVKDDPRVALDFGGIGQGYGADEIALFLQSKGIKDMMVEIGGEGVAMGLNRKRNEPWRIGILDPESTLENQMFKAYATLSNRAFTTSGNYFNYREENGIRYSHIINPKTGYPSSKKLLSVSVFTNDCTTADAWATALMVMGHEQAIEWAAKNPTIPILLFYSGSTGSVETFISPSARPFITMENNPR